MMESDANRSNGAISPALSAVRIGILGLGYVGLPLAFEFARRFPVVGYDVDAERISQIKCGYDRTQEVSREQLAAISSNFSVTDVAASLGTCNVLIVTVPTPINEFKQPDLLPLRAASEIVGGVLERGNVVIYESTVYPGATEEDCVPILEKQSGLEFNEDFFVGYSPERVNPGDAEHRIPDIIKVTSGSTPGTADFVDGLYSSISRVGTYRAPSIKVAEAAKVIENTQRDVNIALVNELAMLFHRMGIDTNSVLDAACTKWNFLPFRPGLVGGHCIGVDPYYLTHKAQSCGFHPEMILAGRRVNDHMGEYVAERVMKLMAQKGVNIVNSRILVLGATFKENCPDLRNAQSRNIVDALRSLNAIVEVYEPYATQHDLQREFGSASVDQRVEGSYDAIIITIAHEEFRTWGVKGVHALLRDPLNGVVFDVKSTLREGGADGRL